MRQILSILLLVTLTSCSAPPTLPPLRIAVFSTWATGAVMFLAEEQGLFAKQGVQVTLLPAADYQTTLKLYREHKVDMSFMLLTDAIMFESEGLATRFIYTTDHSEGSDAIVGQSALNSLNDLRGKKVSFEGFNTFSHLLVLKLLEQAGLTEGDFQSANIEAIEVTNALKDGRIDAGHVYNPYVSEATTKGYKILARSDKVLNLLAEGFVVNAEIAKTRPQEVQKIINALSEAIDWLRRFPEQGVSIMAKRGNVSVTELAETARNLRMLTLSENREEFKPDGSLFEGGQQIVNFFYQKGVLVKIPNLQEVIDKQFVTAK